MPAFFDNLMGWTEKKAPVDFGKTALATAAVAATMTSAIPAYADVPNQRLTSDELAQLSYLQVKGTGLANRCTRAEGEDAIKLSSKGYSIKDMCIEPTYFSVGDEVAVNGKNPEKKFVPAKLMTRQTYTLTGIEGPITVDNGKFTFTEQEGIDYAPTTVQTPGGERVPFLFTVKQLIAKGDGDTVKPGFEFGGDHAVPSYRTGLFLDPKGRGATTGYDFPVALAAR